LTYRHASVLVEEVLSHISFGPDRVVVDCNLGEGGHSAKIAEVLEKYIGTRLIGLERDKKILEVAKKNLSVFGSLPVLVNSNFVDLKKVLSGLSIDKVDAILFDLGISAYHYFDDDRGFSFMKDEPLDMRLDDACAYSASDIINNFDEKKLADIFYTLGEERFSRKIAYKIVRQRAEEKIDTTMALVDVIKSAVPRKFWPKNISVATKVFQALRIYVNSELDNLVNVLPDALSSLKVGGRLLVITFHSLEDRIVKQFFRNKSRGCICPKEVPVCVCNNKPSLKIITKNAIMPTILEVENNKASRSAKLRVAEKVA
jgi:16S rRNA (cytosine1402-N4)-methyltransferase